MKKNQNRGFTLIEMLAVIAVIAILVTIIVPVVTNASDKAAAAADAANLRSAKAAIAVGLLNEEIDAEDTLTAEQFGIPEKGNYNEEPFEVTIDEDGTITVTYGELDIDALAYIAEHGEAAEPGEDVPPESISG